MTKPVRKISPRRPKGGTGEGNPASRRYYLPALALAIALLIPVAIAAYYNHPGYDDFTYSLITKDAVAEGLFSLLENAVATSLIFYQSWQGLYSSAFFLSLQPDIFGCYQLTTAIICAAVFLCGAFLCKSIQKLSERGKGADWLIIAFFFTFFFIQGLPDPSEGLFWFNGAANYILFAAFLLFAAGLYIRLYKACDLKSLIVLAVCSCLLAFVISGGNHVTAFADILLLFGLCAYSLLRRAFCRALRLLPPLVLALAGFAISLSAPGTAVRQSYFTERPDVAQTLLSSFWHAIDQISEWFTLSLLALCILLLPFILRIRPRRFEFSKMKFAILALIPFVSVWLLYCPMEYAMGNFGAGRCDDTIFLIFVAEFLVLFGYIAWSVKPLQSMKVLFAGKGFALAQIACVVVLALPFYGHQSTAHIALSELKNGTLQAYDLAQKERLADIEAAGSGGSVELHEIPATRLYRVSEDLEEEATYLNATWADFAERSQRASELIDKYGGLTDYYDRTFYSNGS